MTSESRVVRSPWSGDEVGRVEDARSARLDAVAAAAVRGFSTWRATPAWKRGEALAAIAAGLRADREGFARALALEAAKPIRDARTEVDRATHTFALAAGASIVIKPAPQTPLVAQRLGAVALAAGVPADVFSVVPVANEHAAHLVEDDRFAVLSRFAIEEMTERKTLVLPAPPA